MCEPYKSTEGRVLAIGISYEDVGEERRGRPLRPPPSTSLVTIGGRPLPVPDHWSWPKFVAIEGGDVLAIHGFGLDDAMAPVERFDGESAKWRSVEPMPVVREPQVVAMDDGRVLVAGGIKVEPGRREARSCRASTSTIPRPTAGRGGRPP